MLRYFPFTVVSSICDEKKYQSMGQSFIEISSCFIADFPNLVAKFRPKIPSSISRIEDVFLWNFQTNPLVSIFCTRKHIINFLLSELHMIEKEFALCRIDASSIG
mmetsp:Transcript_17217/g.29656  ORF Transcript_17217/g.29656 Transcript_17217/m.29656 type:complete len:105 (-) Transcript_17217:687-1001(-)